MKHQKVWSLWLVRAAAVFGLIGAGLGAHMAGSGGYQFRAIHAHILVVGWLSLFSWAAYYRLFFIRSKKIAALHVYTALIGTIGLTGGMWLEFLKPFPLPDIVTLLIYIIGGSILLLSFFLFLLTTFWIGEEEK
ncbi:hypothetical protein [Planomicrobium sp. YIM 101495]|uniref:hypothetical protein n=1 Tax=Planomicrobium sp. YIM 101495 TaxID=2665160 RepID=UPI0012B70221|nr:hypothetical protein [Planomicrobium sp. YIM 101495]MTD29977.1 hypothetical protein [Planomicrobium sp. YIM 101495]